MIYVSITTIPPRVKNLNKSVESLLNQTKKPDKIFINIPHNYRRFKEIINNNVIPKFNNENVQITRCEDYGPGTKLLGSLDKLNKDCLLILADDDHYYENYMIEKFFKSYCSAPENAYSFYVHRVKNLECGQGADGFAINTKYLTNIQQFYNLVIKDYKELFLHDDLWISFFLRELKKCKIISLQKFLKKGQDGKLSLIYKIHNRDNGLIQEYGSNLNEAVKNRDKISSKSLDYLYMKTKNLTF